jgi:glycosyltransferase involved in cell wall biosynthesis
VFLGYDAVDNDYFAAETAKWRKQKIENRNQKSEGKNQFQLSAFPISTFENTPFFLASARFIEKKNLPRLIQAYARYRELAQIEDRRSKMEDGGGKSESGKQKAEIWNLVLLGDGPLRKEIELRIADCGLRNSVLLPGFKQYPDLPAYYAHAGAFIHASTTEQWGLVVNEAMASGLPVLVSNRCGCAAELVQEGVNGFTFDPLNVEQLAQLMLRISDFRFPISDFGVASARIIAGWGPERFASGLMQAAECALRAGPVNPSLLQRTILNVLLQK